MRYSVQVTRDAERELRIIIRWLRERSQSGAEAWLRRWAEVLDELSNSPESFGIAPEDEETEDCIQQAIFRTRKGLPYRALFLVREETVFVLHVRGSGQDRIAPEDLHTPN